MKRSSADPDEEMKLQIQGLIPPGQQFYRNVLFDELYASIPKDAEAKVQIYTAEIAPKGWTNFHCHNGATFFLALQGIFEAHFEEGVLVRAKAGDVYSEPIGKDASRPQSSRNDSLPLRRRLHYRAGSRPRDERPQSVLKEWV